MYPLISYTTGSVGSGKTFSQVNWLVRDYLRNTDGLYYTNLPIYPQRIAVEAAKVRWGNKATREQKRWMRSRLKIIPESVVMKWSQGTGGPWEYFKEIERNEAGKAVNAKGKVVEEWEESPRPKSDEEANGFPGRLGPEVVFIHPTDGAHLDLDEIHNICGKGHHIKYKWAWESFLGEIRHLGMSINVITQSENKLPSVFDTHAVARNYVKNASDVEDPVFKVPFDGWFELLASLNFWETDQKKRYPLYVWRDEEKRDKKTYETVRKVLVKMNTDGFRLYDSFDKPQQGGQSAKGPRRLYLTRSRLQVLLWFSSEYMGRIVPRLVLGAFVLSVIIFPAFFIEVLHDRISILPQAAAQGLKDDLTEEIEESAPVPDALDRDELPPLPPLKLPPPPELDPLIDPLAAVVPSLAVMPTPVPTPVPVPEIEFLSGGRVKFSGSRMIRVGEEFKRGYFEGLLITEVDYAEKRVLLSDGSEHFLY